MNASISGMIDLLFKDTAMNNETRALYEELLNNCQEHYDDLISRGLSETEALDAVVESLQGMKEVIDEYPKKASSSAPEASEEPRVRPEPPVQKPDEAQGNQVFTADNLRSIIAEVRNCDLTLNRSLDGKIHVRSEKPELYRCELNKGCLRITQNNHAGPTAEDFNMKPEEISVKGILSFVGKVISKTANIITEQTGIYIDVPEIELDEIRMSSMSGDIDGCHISARKIQLGTTSGDITFSIPDYSKPLRFIARSTSGDVTVQGSADEIELNSISGDAKMTGECLEAILKSTSGDVEIDASADRISSHTISGSQKLTVRNAGIQSINAASTSGSVDIFLPEGIPGVRQTMRSVSGSLRSRYTDSGYDASLEIHASTVSGSINIH